jgi:hypothetical protein
MRTLAFGATATLLAAFAPLFGQPQIRQERVEFAGGKASTTVKGSLQGDETLDYIFTAAAGQQMAIFLQNGKGSSVYFNITGAGEDSALFIGSTSGDRFKGTIAKAGDYTARVYQMRSAARRGKRADYTITFQMVSGDKASAKPAAPTGGRPAKYDASGTVKCSAGEARFNKQCEFRVVRNSGKADIWIVAPDGMGKVHYRVLHYSDKVFTTNGKSKLAWQRQDDNWWVSANGREFYLIPDALIYGG